MSDIYKHWNDDEALAKYATPRKWAGRFRSEVHFLEKVFKPGMSVLDIGSCTGDLYHGLKERFGELNYTGIDCAEKMVEAAQQSASAAQFIKGNILEEEITFKDQPFDLVIATGVFQHEEHYQKLLSRMIDYVKEGGYVLFDVKLLYNHPTLCDITKAYCDYPDRLFYIALNIKEAIELILKQDKIENRAEFYGYYSGVKNTVRLPESLKEEVCSAHILLQRGRREKGGQFDLSLNLPEEFIANCFKNK